MSLSPHRIGIKLKRAASAAAIILAILPACAYAESAGFSVSSSAPNTGDQALRLESIGYRLAQANADRCDHPEMLTGLMLHNIGGYAEADRAEFTREFGLTYGFGVVSVVPGSVADLVGIAKGDEIVSVNGTELSGFARDQIRKGASYDRTEALVGLLDKVLQNAPANLVVRHGSILRTVQLAAAKGCGGKFTVVHSDELNAWSDGRYVAVTDKMMNFASDDNELSFVVAHEMSHNILHHAEQLKGTSNLFAEFGFGARKVKRTEIEADSLAVELMDRAGYAPSSAESLLRRTGQERWMDLALTHPNASRRIKIVDATIARMRITPRIDALPV